MVAKIKRVLKNTRGVFLPRPSSYQKKDVSSIRYLDSSNDRKNLRGDLKNVGGDFKKATQEAKIKFCV